MGPHQRKRPTVRRVLPAVLALSAVLLAGCSSPDTAAGPGVTEPAASPATQGEAAAQAAPPLEDEPGSVGTVGFQEIPEIVREVGPSTVAVNVTVQRQGTTAQGAGSGVIWSADGIIVTNNHVVEGAQQVEVALASGRRYPAEIVATDPRTDLAVISIDATRLPAASFADQLPDVGELAVAIGNPLGFQNTATAGIVSGLDRSLPAQGGNAAALVGLIQTDAAISSGNSGGALVDSARRVIGINVAAISPPGGARVVAENVGFAIPSTTVTRVVEQLLETGDVQHPYLGIRGTTITPQIAERFAIQRDRGVIVAQVEPGGPADQAGLRPGDVIVGLGGREVSTFGDLASALRGYAPGDTVQVTVVRDGEERTFQLTLGELPDGGTGG